MYANCMPDTVIQAQAVLREVALLYKIPKSEKGDKLAKCLLFFFLP